MPRKKEIVEDYYNLRVSPIEAANFLKLSERTFYRLVEEGIIPKLDNGVYVLGEVVEAYYKNQNSMKGLTAAKTRLATAKAEMAELELAEQRGELVRESAIIKVWTDNVLNCKKRLLAISPKLALVLVGKTITEIKLKIEAEIKEALKELAEYDGEKIKQAAKSQRG
ncbi:MAG: helix-turn-helix domain-containing protein [Synergistaceae bacterium]|nr:helix-turn-helix domain-containing protein [Synergistaceae bacterium]